MRKEWSFHCVSPVPQWSPVSQNPQISHSLQQHSVSRSCSVGPKQEAGPCSSDSNSVSCSISGRGWAAQLRMKIAGKGMTMWQAYGLGCIGPTSSCFNHGAHQNMEDEVWQTSRKQVVCSLAVVSMEELLQGRHQISKAPGCSSLACWPCFPTAAASTERRVGCGADGRERWGLHTSHPPPAVGLTWGLGKPQEDKVCGSPRIFLLAANSWPHCKFQGYRGGLRYKCGTAADDSCSWMEISW